MRHKHSSVWVAVGLFQEIRQRCTMVQMKVSYQDEVYRARVHLIEERKGS